MKHEKKGFLTSYTIITDNPKSYLIKVEGKESCLINRKTYQITGWTRDTTIKEIKELTGACLAIAKDLQASMGVKGA